jgi:Flp pilus assembly protein TadD
MTRYRLAPAKVQRVEAAILTQDALDAFDRGAYTDALAAIDDLKRLAPAERPLAMVEAWSLFKLKRYDDARTAFRQIYDTYQSKEAAEGLKAIKAKVDPKGLTGPAL